MIQAEGVNDRHFEGQLNVPLVVGSPRQILITIGVTRAVLFRYGRKEMIRLDYLAEWCIAGVRKRGR